MPKETNTPQAAKGPGHGGPVKLTVEKPKHFKKSLGKLLAILKPHRISLLMTVLLTVIATVFSIISPKFLGNMTNSIVNDFIANKTYSTLHEALESQGITLPTGTTLSELP
ncbi:MAG: hypothetical protein LBD11_03280 [Candidatus Peribacteria bacterium]|jgi:ATP-binding cassette subfamily B protein|nr:hypothetical protein [Candidatus Peribacteria bacterium]